MIDQQQQQLQDRILSILNGGDVGNALASVASSLTSTVSAAPPQPKPEPVPNLGAVNLDNPSVQKALNDLMQTGPLMTSMGGTKSTPTPASSQAYSQQQMISSQAFQQNPAVSGQYAVSGHSFVPY